MPDIILCSTPQEVAHTAAEHIVSLAKESITDRGRFKIALAGGGTPVDTYQALASPEFSPRVDWERVHVFWGDERPVPPHHEDSNYRMTRQNLLKDVPIPKENIHRMQGELEPHKAAENYQQTLRELFDQQPPRLDLILLGMGRDGHTASLFPGTALLYEKERWIAAHYIQKLKSWRITFTPPLINAAANVIFLVTGEGKADILKRVLSGPYQPETYPAQLIQPENGTLLWLLDAEAAKLL